VHLSPVLPVLTRAVVSRVRQAYACIGLPLSEKHFEATPENLKRPPEERTITRRDTTILRVQWPIDFTHQDARNLVKNDPFFLADRLYGVGVEGDDQVTWQVIGVAVRRRQWTYEVEMRSKQLDVLDEDRFLHLLDKTQALA